MLKKISSIVLSLVLVAIIFLNAGQLLENVYAYGTRSLVLGRYTTNAYDYTPTVQKEITGQEFLVICQGATYQSAQSARSCKALPQHHPKSNVLTDMYANDVALTYTFKEGFDERMVNGYAAGDFVTVRFGPVSNNYYTYFTAFYHYY